MGIENETAASAAERLAACQGVEAVMLYRTTEAAKVCGMESEIPKSKADLHFVVVGGRDNHHCLVRICPVPCRGEYA